MWLVYNTIMLIALVYSIICITTRLWDCDQDQRVASGFQILVIWSLTIHYMMVVLSGYSVVGLSLL